MNDWHIFRGAGRPHDGIVQLPAPPPWRKFDGGPVLPSPGSGAWRPAQIERAASYQADPEVLGLVNAAIYLRRPLLVTGKPGVGKSTLALAIAYELKLGPVLHWAITSRSTLKESLYGYDAISRLQDLNDSDPDADSDLGRYLTLGPLGTALLPHERPRVLLIDEIDKSDIDLPNDLLTVFEEGEYDIPELRRIAHEHPEVSVTPADSTKRVPIAGGWVRCRAFPIVVMTSNGEREFPLAFRRRCIAVEIQRPSRERLVQIIEARLGREMKAIAGTDLLDKFLDRQQHGDLATDQLLNAIYLTFHAARENGRDRTELADMMLQHLRTTPA